MAPDQGTPPPRPPVPIDPFDDLPEVECADGKTMDEECKQGKKDVFGPQLDAEHARLLRVTSARRDKRDEDLAGLDPDDPARVEIEADYQNDLDALTTASDGERLRIKTEYTAAVLADCCTCDDN